MPASQASVIDRPEAALPGGAAPWVIMLADGDRLGQAQGSPALAGGERKLLLVGPAPASPPSVAEQGSRVAVFDGVLHDRPELIDRLRHRSPRTPSDAELVLEAYRSWGGDLVHRIKGIYAAVVWDSERDELIAVRDRFGLHPLFYAPTGRALLLSSSIEALVRHPLVSAGVNRPALVERLSHRWPFLDETYFANVKRVPPGHALRRRGGELSVARYWEPAALESAADWVTGDDVERFDHLLDQAVARSLDRGTPAIYLSGGLDSVTVAAVATDTCRRRGLAPPLALSLVFPDPASEEDAQRRIAGDLGLPQYLATMAAAAGPEGLIPSALRRSAESPAPLLNLWAPAYEHLSLEGKSRGASTILTGNGGDEWLTVSLYYAADLLARGDIAGLWEFLGNMTRSNRLSAWIMLRLVLWTYGARPLVAPSVARRLDAIAPAILPARRRRNLARETPAWVAPEPALRREVLDRYEERVEARHQQDARSPRSYYVGELRRMLDSPVIALEHEEFFESGRRTGMPLLHPFWDADLVEFLYRVPPRLLNQGGRSKGLVRQSLARRFPTLGFGRHRKLNANNFFGSVVATEGIEAWRRMGGARALAGLGVAEQHGLSERVEHLVTRGRPMDIYHLWHLLSVEAWLQARA